MPVRKRFVIEMEYHKLKEKYPHKTLEVLMELLLLLISLFLFIWFIGIGLEVSSIKRILKKVLNALEEEEDEEDEEG